jgi:prepilin-type processing-associated H-X9-DG protein
MTSPNLTSIDNTIATGTRYYYRPSPKWNSPSPDDYGVPSTTTTLEANAAHSELDLAFEWSSLNPALATPVPGYGTRASDQINSRHGGLIVSAFCDGHVSPIQENIDIDVFKQLMTPYGASLLNSTGSYPVNYSNATTNLTTYPTDAPIKTLDDASL